jgi:hypothetical protein
MKDKLNNFLENLKQNRLSEIDFSKLFDWAYLTDPTPPKNFIYEQWIYVIVLLNLFLSIVGFQYCSKIFFESRPKYRLIRRLAFWWLVNTIFLLLYNLLRVEAVKFLSMRLFLVAIIFLYLVILVYFLCSWTLVLPKQLERFNEAKLRERYSKPKKRK